MNQIAELLPEGNVALDVDAATKARLFEAVALLFQRDTGLAPATIVASLTAREKLGSTGLGQGIAIPHGRLKGLAEARGAFLRLATPIQFDSPDGKPVSQVFVLLVPEHATDRHLQLLSELAQMFSERSFREQLAAARTAHEVHALISDWSPSA
ncbi:MAG TPA: PTS IIA-like nitrogen regulatory protein PtsN [Casimicrobiaceae bacterium]|nr:PTS IIA-like nitrogen regulatory protein PtsN [Casimicrobiaceae bacterium]